MTLDLSQEADVRRLVDEYAERQGLELGPYHFNREHAVQAVLFFPRHLRLTKGEWAGRPFVLQRWQAWDIVIPAFGWKDQDGTRRFRRAHIWVPRKNGKTELLGGLGAIHLVCDGEHGGEIYSIASKEEQARITFDVGKAMIRRGPDELKRHLRLFADCIWCEPFSASWRPLGGMPKGSHGKGPSVIIGDEVHEWVDDRLHKFLRDGMGARQQPMEWTISTAGEQQGFGWELWNVCQDLLNGTLEDPRTLAVIYAAGPKDDWGSPDVWAKANPNLNVSLKLKFLNDQYQQARRLARYENDFKRYHLDLWVGQAERWLKIEDWDKGGVWRTGQQKLWLERFESFRGRRCFGGVDLASTQDTCALIWLFEPGGARQTWDVLCRFWLPSDGLAERVRHSRVSWDAWAHEGAVTLTDGNAADYDRIEADIRDDLDLFDVQKLGFDPWNANQIMISLNKEREDIAVKVPQTMLGVSGGTKRVERQVLRGELDHGGHPILRWMAGNCAVVKDEKENIMVAKRRSAAKIDGIAALCTAEALAAGFEDETVPNVYEERGFVVL
jgi:phage terminase large subunit-like protein